MHHIDMGVNKLIDCHKGRMKSFCLNTSWTASMNEFTDTGSTALAHALACAITFEEALMVIYCSVTSSF